MQRRADVIVAAVCCALVLTGFAGAAAAAVTPGDLMLSSEANHTRKSCITEFYGPKGNVKATVRLGNYNVVWGHAVSQDGRYAAIGLLLLTDHGTRAFGPPKDPIKITLLQLTGASPKVLGTRILRYVHHETWNRGKNCHYAGSSPLALKSRMLPGRAGAALDVYLSIMCVADKLTMSDPCSRAGLWDGTSYVKHWSITHVKFKSLGPILPGRRAAFPEKPRCGPVGISLATAATGKLYAAYAFNRHVREGEVKFVGVYEVQRSPKGTMRLVPTWKFKIENTGLGQFVPTGPVTGCGLATNSKDITKVYSFAKGQAPHGGGFGLKRPNYLPGPQAIDTYGGIDCRGTEVYATLGKLGEYIDNQQLHSVLKVSNRELKGGTTGRVVFRTARSFSRVAIIP